MHKRIVSKPYLIDEWSSSSAGTRYRIIETNPGFFAIEEAQVNAAGDNYWGRPLEEKKALQVLAQRIAMFRATIIRSRQLERPGPKELDSLLASLQEAVQQKLTASTVYTKPGAPPRKNKRDR